MGSAGWGGTPQTVRHFASAMLKADAVALLEHLEPSTDAAPGRARVLRVYRLNIDL
jgi:hypothetical protein